MNIYFTIFATIDTILLYIFVYFVYVLSIDHYIYIYIYTTVLCIVYTTLVQIYYLHTLHTLDNRSFILNRTRNSMGVVAQMGQISATAVVYYTIYANAIFLLYYANLFFQLPHMRVLEHY